MTHMFDTIAHPWQADRAMPLWTESQRQAMPPLDLSGRPLSFYEFWPMSAFYGPVFLYVLWLMLRHRGINLPTIANPSFPGGGFYGESKAAILDLVPV